MKIVVLVKEVPDTGGARKLNLETGLADREASDPIIDEICERAVEAALRIKEAKDDGEIDVQVLSMTPESAASSVRKGLQMGASSATQVADPALLGADLTLTAEVLAAAIKKGEYDLIVTGNLSTDGSGGVLPAMLAEHLDYPELTGLTSIEVEGSEVTGTAVTDAGTLHLRAELPAVVSITESFPDARYPKMKDLRAAKKKPFDVISLDDLGVDAEDFSHPRTIMTAASEQPPREAGTKITDEGDGGKQLAEYLISNRLI